ncbi:MAG TPA: hypothetical protein VFO11_12605, partial [Candidatus Polarisedimenticolaceae bacterium]|nr:hypothetical protein [Candidatus Polarisedimenticolaceae bacterium]
MTVYPLNTAIRPKALFTGEDAASFVVTMTKRIILALSVVLALAVSPAHGQSCREWRLRATTGPSPRGEFGLVYDSRRSMTVLVGGAQNLGFSSVFRET